MPTETAAPPSVSVADMKVVSNLIDGIFKFRNALVGYEFYSYQLVFARRIIEALLLNTGDTITALWSRQSGKTTAAAELNITLSIIIPVLARAMPHIEILRPYAKGLRIGIFAPVQQQAQLSYDKMRSIIHSDRAEEILADEEISLEIASSRGDTLELSNDSVIHAKTASPESKVEGSTYHIILVDEAQAVDRFKVDKEIEPMRASTNGVMVKIGTAHLSRGGFHSDIEYNIEAHKRGGPRNHFEFDANIVIKEKREAYKRDGNPLHLAYEKYVDGQRRKLGENSLAFRMNFLLKWQESRMDAISARAMLDSQYAHRELFSMPPANEKRNYLRVAGVDIAKSNDSTVVSILELDMDNPVRVEDPLTKEVHTYYPGLFVAFLELQGDFEDLPGGDKGQYSKIVSFLRTWQPTRICVDATSMGDPVYERLTVLAPELDFEAFRYSTSTKSDLFKYYLDEWESGRLRVASGGRSKEMREWENFYDQHKNLEKTWSGNYMLCQAPEPASSARKLTDQNEFHDDYPNSAALAYWAAKTDLVAEVRIDAPQPNPHTRVPARYNTRSSYSRYRSRRG